MRRGISDNCRPYPQAIISLLALQAMTPNALAEHFESTRQAVTKHIKILTECELINQKQSGIEIYYQLDIKKIKKSINGWNYSERCGKINLTS